MPIPDQWYAIVQTRSIKQSPIQIRRLSEDLLLWRTRDGSLHCAVDRCPHRGAQLSLGRIVDDCLECPYHGLRFDGAGQCTLIPMNGRDAKVPRAYRLRTFPVREHRGLVWMWWGEKREHYPDLPWLPGLPPGERGVADWVEEWPIHYTRYIEAYFDLAHGAFVHRTLGFGFLGARLDDAKITEEDGLITSRAIIRHDDKPDSKGYPFSTFVRFPNLLRLDLAPGLILFSVGTPIDDEHTWIFARYYQTWIQNRLFSWLGWLISWIALWIEFRIVQPQDKRMLFNMTPKILNLGDNILTKQEKGLAIWMRRRHRAIAKKERESGD